MSIASFLKSNLGVALAVAALCLPEGGNAQEFYRGKTIKIIVGGSAGGSYDIPARVVAKILPKYIPGKPQVIVQNMPAAAGMAAINYVYNVAAKDGTELGVFNRNTVIAPLIGNQAAKFEVDKFKWIGTPASYKDDAQVFMIRGELPQKTIEDLRIAKKPLQIGNTGTAITEILPQALGVKMNIIRGYQSADLNLAVERGEVDGRTLAYGNVAGLYPYWISSGMIRFMIVFGHEKRFPPLPDVPTARELARTPEDLALIKFVEAPLGLGTPYAAPPEVPDDRVAILREAFMRTMNDPEFRAEVELKKMEYSPASGEELEAVMHDLARTDTSVIRTYTKIVERTD